MDSGFVNASELGPSPSIDEEMHNLILKQAAELEILREIKLDNSTPTKPTNAATIKPQEWQALQIVINDLLSSNEAMHAAIETQARQMKGMKEELSNATEAIKEIREHFPALIGSINKRLSALETPEKSPGKTNTERVQKLIRYMNARPDHKASFETLKGHFQIKDNQLNAIIIAANQLDHDRFTIIKDEHDGRKRWLIVRKYFKMK